MPRATGVVDPLPRLGDESLRSARPPIFIRTNDDQERARRKRHKSLTAERMPLHHPQAVRQGTGPGTEDIDQNPCVFTRCLNLGQVVETMTVAAIDEEALR